MSDPRHPRRRAVLITGDAKGWDRDSGGIRPQIRIADGGAGSRIAVCGDAHQHVAPPDLVRWLLSRNRGVNQRDRTPSASGSMPPCWTAAIRSARAPRRPDLRRRAAWVERGRHGMSVWSPRRCAIIPPNDTPTTRPPVRSRKMIEKRRKFVRHGRRYKATRAHPTARDRACRRGRPGSAWRKRHDFLPDPQIAAERIRKTRGGAFRGRPPDGGERFR